MFICPACLSSNSKFHSYRFNQKGGNYFPCEYQLIVCNQCGLWFKDNIPSQESLKSFYNSLNVNGSSWNYINRSPHERKLDYILSTLADKSKVLDVGCWTGRFLAAHSLRLKVYGIEANSSAAEIAQQRGLTILVSTEKSDSAKRTHRV